MKKLLITVTILTLGFATSAHAFSLGGYTGPVTFDYIGYGAASTYPVGTNVSGIADGNMDTFAILKNIAILDPVTTTLIWTSTASESLEGVFYGIDDDTVFDTSTGQDIWALGGHIDLYLTTSNINPTGGPAPAPPLAGLGNPYPVGGDPWNVTDGTLFLSLDLVPGVTPLDPTVTYVAENTAATIPVRGKSTFYASVTGGAYATLFDTDGYDHIYSGADFFFSNDYSTEALTPAQLANGWLTYVDGVALGRTVPEPATMTLFGSGLMGLIGAAIRKRKLA